MTTRRRRVLVDRDKIMHADSTGIAQLCAHLFSTVQDKPPEDQLLGLAAAFIVLAEACGIPTQDVYTAVTNLMYDPLHSSGRKHQFAAMNQYLKDDVL